jgi:hypothetical protein
MEQEEQSLYTRGHKKHIRGKQNLQKSRNRSYKNLGTKIEEQKFKIQEQNF